VVVKEVAVVASVVKAKAVAVVVAKVVAVVADVVVNVPKMMELKHGYLSPN
jgi:hypothetical protein